MSCGCIVSDKLLAQMADAQVTSRDGVPAGKWSGKDGFAKLVKLGLVEPAAAGKWRVSREGMRKVASMVRRGL